MGSECQASASASCQEAQVESAEDDAAAVMRMEMLQMSPALFRSSPQMPNADPYTEDVEREALKNATSRYGPGSNDTSADKDHEAAEKIINYFLKMKEENPEQFWKWIKRAMEKYGKSAEA